jgi:hypothetical protein
MRLELTHRFAIPLRAGFDYLVETRNWPEYWPGLIRVLPGTQWRAPGDRARVLMRLLARSAELEMTLHTFDPYSLVEYTSVQRGLPDARHERGFADLGDGFEYRLAVEFEPRAGLRGAFDRGPVRRAVDRTMQRTVANLEDRLSRLPPHGTHGRRPGHRHREHPRGAGAGRGRDQ